MSAYDLKRDRILEVAYDMVKHKGFLSVRKVSIATGCARDTVQKYCLADAGLEPYVSKTRSGGLLKRLQSGDLTAPEINCMEMFARGMTAQQVWEVIRDIPGNPLSHRSVIRMFHFFNKKKRNAS